VIAEDEARHAELAFRTLVWAIQVGGADVADAVAKTFAQAIRNVGMPAGSARASLRAHGRLGDEALRQAAKRAVDDVLLPAIEALQLQRWGDLTHLPTT
jgi:hypothetical protein